MLADVVTASAQTFPGRVLFLTEDADALKRQLRGEDLPGPPDRLCDNISTDEITPGWVCFWYDETLGSYSLVGLRNGAVEKDSIKSGGFSVLVSGKSKGCGSSRETAPYSEKSAGIRLVIARTIEKIYGQNCQNIGLFTSTDFGLIERIQRGEAIPMAEFTRGLDPISTAIVEHGGLFAYNQARLAGRVSPPLPETPRRPMTLVEKIIASHAVVDAKAGELGIASVKPGDAVFCRTDVRFTHDYVTPMAASLFHEGFGKDARVADVKNTYAFRDHLTFIGKVMPEKQKKMGLLKLADDLAVTQQDFCEKQGIRLYGEDAAGGSEAICHNAVLEDIALPGQLVAGTDSHTCTAGALGCFAFGVGSTDMANAWLTRDVRVTVPQSVYIELRGIMPVGLAAKDVMLLVMADAYFKDGKAIGQVLEFAGEAVERMSLDERATLTNMAVEAGATSGIIAADMTTLAYLKETRGIEARSLDRALLRSDEGATYAHRIVLDLSMLRPMVATPGDPRNGVPIDSLPAEVRVNIAYGGSCTGGKKADMDMYAEVLEPAVARGWKVKAGVRFFIQFGSQKIKRYAEERGYIELFERAGAELINPSCGACIKAGPGVSESPDDVSISAINRNFPGRSGPGKVYLASPQVVAASAIAGRILTPERLLKDGP
jgi:3-isopropylmalate/(R)-2-methylmalate dehydratase large subunit